MITPKFKIWLKCAGIRALKTFAQTAGATIISFTGQAIFTMGDVNWGIVGSSALIAAILSLCTSVGGLPEVDYEEEARKLEETRRTNGQV